MLIGHVTLEFISGVSVLVSYLEVKSLQFIWDSDIRKFHLRVTDPQMNCRDLTTWQGTSIDFQTWHLIGWQHSRQRNQEPCWKSLMTSMDSWWRHQMETYSALLALCAGNSPITGKFPIQRPVTRSFDVSFNLRLNKRLSKQSWGCWFETSPLCFNMDFTH